MAARNPFLSPPGSRGSSPRHHNSRLSRPWRGWSGQHVLQLGTQLMAGRGEVRSLLLVSWSPRPPESKGAALSGVSAVVVALSRGTGRGPTSGERAHVRSGPQPSRSGRGPQPSRT